MSEQPLVYVGCKPCGCRIGAIRSDTASIAGVAAFLKHGGAIHTLDAEAAARMPAACDICKPVRQETLL